MRNNTTPTQDSPSTSDSRAEPSQLERAHAGGPAVSFAGFPAAAFSFYDALTQENSRAFWAAHVEEYHRSIRGPMTALLDDLAAEFGTGKLFRPNRDVRFSTDKSPYKDHQGGFIQTSTTCGYYVQVDSESVLAGGGWYSSSPEQVARFRNSVLGSAGEELSRIVADLRAAGYEIGGTALKSRPRGVPSDHPRIELLRHRSLTMHTQWDASTPWVATADALQHVQAAWRAATPLLTWLGSYATDPPATGLPGVHDGGVD